MTPDPPRLAVRLLAIRLTPPWRDYVLGDLQEEFTARARQSPTRARRWFWRQTLRCLVSPPQTRQARAATRSLGETPMRSILSDLRYAIRVPLRAPSFSLAVIVVLALGIGATTAIFSIINTVLLRPLPFEEPDRLVRLFHVPPQATFPGIRRFPVSAANYYDWEREAASFERMAIYRFRQFVLTGSGQARAVVAVAVGDGLFDIVRVPPALGRRFGPEDDRPGARVVIVSDAFWKTHLGGRPDATSATLRLNGESYAIVGVMPPEVTVKSWGATALDLWVPLGYTAEQRAVRENHNAQVIARLRPEVTIAQAEAELQAISARLERAYPAENAGWGATVVSLHELIVGDIRRWLVMLLGAVALVLMIACANVGNLLFARGLARRKELAIRAALGAGRRRVFQQLLIEALVLAVIGGAAGLLVARAAIQAGAALLASQLPRADELAIDSRVLLFALATSMLAGIVAGVLPARRAGRTDLTETLKEGGRGDAAAGVRTRRALIVAEVALSVVLLMGAGVLLRSLTALRAVDVGIDARNVLTLRLSRPQTPNEDADRSRAFFLSVLDRLRALPGVAKVGAIDDLPTQSGSVQPLVVAGRPELPPNEQPTVEVRQITPGYLQAIGIPLLRGRDVADADRETVLVSASAAKLLWGDAEPIGTRVTLPLVSRDLLRDVVGVVGDVKQGELADAAAPTVYLYTRERPWNTLVVVMRTSVPPLSLVRAAETAVHAIDPEQPLEQVRPMTAVLDATVTSERLSTLLLGLFAALAVVLAAVGIYSVLSHIVRGRMREIGIRAALGASTGAVVRLVVREGMTPALAGIALGVVASLSTAGLLERLVFGVSPTDPLTLAAVVVGLAVVALFASAIPAWRAARLDTLRVLRS